LFAPLAAAGLREIWIIWCPATTSQLKAENRIRGDEERTKIQQTKPQASSKHQEPLLAGFGACSLVFPWNLDLGTWNS